MVLSVCFRAYGQSRSSPTVSSTAAATIRQAVAIVFDHAASTGQGGAAEAEAAPPPAAAAAAGLLQDVCIMSTGEQGGDRPQQQHAGNPTACPAVWAMPARTPDAVAGALSWAPGQCKDMVQQAVITLPDQVSGQRMMEPAYALLLPLCSGDDLFGVQASLLHGCAALCCHACSCWSFWSRCCFTGRPPSRATPSWRSC